MGGRCPNGPDVRAAGCSRSQPGGATCAADRKRRRCSASRGGSAAGVTARQSAKWSPGKKVGSFCQSSAGRCCNPIQAAPIASINSPSTLLRVVSSHFLAGSALQKFVDECLVGLCLLGSQTAELGEKPRSNADGNQLLGVTGHGPAHAARAAELLVSGFRNIGKVQPAIRHMLYVLSALPGAR